MIQRIQTLFLLLGAAASFTTLALPFATTSQAIEGSAIFSDQIFDVNDHIALLVVFAVGGALAVAAIFLFKKRPVQLLLALLAALVNAGGGILAGAMYSQDGHQSQAVLGAGIAMPLIALAMHMVARRFIRKDEQLVKSMDRLR